MGAGEEGRHPIVASKKSRPARSSPSRRLILRLVLLASLLLGLAVAFFRLQGIGRVTDKTRALNKRFGNPPMMRLAGRRYFFAGLIRHTGRRSRREYATPVWAVPTADGFVVSLPFGEGADWLKNVQAAGRATIETRGKSWEVADPEVLDRETAWPSLPRRARFLFGLAGIERYLKLRRL
jgi:deazaflavin-dependent oxidoreductase (nitroreductase family)